MANPGQDISLEVRLNSGLICFARDESSSSSSSSGLRNSKKEEDVGKWFDSKGRTRRLVLVLGDTTSQVFIFIHTYLMENVDHQLTQAIPHSLCVCV